VVNTTGAGPCTGVSGKISSPRLLVSEHAAIEPARTWLPPLTSDREIQQAGGEAEAGSDERGKPMLRLRHHAKATRGPRRFL
jgi:hypothetical protein